MEFKTVLVVGGTGMLAKATRYLADHASQLILVSRDSLATAKRLGLSSANCVSADWTTVPAFLAATKPTIDRFPPDLIILWMHESGLGARLGLLDMVRGSNCRIVDIHGSGSGKVLDRVAQRRLEVVQAGCRYTAVVLGAVQEHDRSSRWLTHDEISLGVIQAIKSTSDCVVGSI
ncbi:hypothetical protein C2134_02675 [Chromobacterium sinusclupearum]|uniref:Short-chain dehydrogenase n=1 Tax=Chromobacterium sinusclupearum TaxID=2077146 RepID=A0A2K4MT88_9NEIS|nr:hypothetical protein [Chromobacterium sinusclupearum]POB00190.1 hypothetical protein C2134_02675 [Chromobacterium sinusclupearum]